MREREHESYTKTMANEWCVNARHDEEKSESFPQSRGNRMIFFHTTTIVKLARNAAVKHSDSSAWCSSMKLYIALQLRKKKMENERLDITWRKSLHWLLFCIHVERPISWMDFTGKLDYSTASDRLPSKFIIMQCLSIERFCFALAVCHKNNQKFFIRFASRIFHEKHKQARRDCEISLSLFAARRTMFTARVRECSCAATWGGKWKLKK